jgi:hypothetical protein
MIHHRARTAAGQRHAHPRSHRILTVAAVCLAMTACQSNAEPRSPDQTVSSKPGSPAIGSAAASDSTAIPQAARTFRALQQPCTVIDQPPIVNVLGPESGNIIPPRTETRSGVTFMTCNRTYGTPGGSRTVLSLRLQLADPAAIKVQYDGLRRVNERQVPLADVTGLGQGAYAYTDPQVGENLAAYDGNLYLTLLVSPVMGPAKPTTEVRPMMIESAKAAMTKLSQ